MEEPEGGDNIEDGDDKDEPGVENKALCSYTQESGLAALNNYCTGSQRGDPTCHKYYGTLKRWLNKYCRAKNVESRALQQRGSKEKRALPNDRK